MAANPCPCGHGPQLGVCDACDAPVCDDCIDGHGCDQEDDAPAFTAEVTIRVVLSAKTEAALIAGADYIIEDMQIQDFGEIEVIDAKRVSVFKPPSSGRTS